jgi:Leucine-rich repeat (LRR) protein
MSNQYYGNRSGTLVIQNMIVNDAGWDRAFANIQRALNSHTITKIKFDHNELYNLPASLKMLPFKSVYIINNPTEKIVCNEVFHPDLTELYIENTFINSITGFEGLTKLKHLTIEVTQITSLPSDIGHLINLKNITLDNCRITSLPESFGNLTNLTNISLNTCLITSLPESFGNLKHLKQINIDNTKLRNLPESFGDLPELNNLSIENCPLNHIPESFGNLKKLKYFNINYTNTSTLPESFGNLHHLEELFISNVALNSLPESFGNLKKLKEFELKDTPNITTLPESFGNLSKLQRLFVSHCPLIGLPDNISNLKDLTELYLYATEITTLPESFGNLPNLQEFLIINSPLHNLPDNISGLKELIKLHVVSTGITTIPESIGELENITEIILDNNLGLNSLPDTIRNFKQPVTIQLERTRLARNQQNIPRDLPDNIRIVIPVRPVIHADIHAESAKIDFEKISNFIIEKMRKDDVPENFNYARFIQNILTLFITNVYEAKPDEAKQEQRLNKLSLIMSERLSGLNYNNQSPVIKNAVRYSLKYINSQPEEVQEYYIDNLLDDCIEAYAESNRQISCAAGILERIVTTMVPALAPFKENNRDYQTIIDLIEITPAKHIPELIKQWYQAHRTGSANAFPADMSEEDKRKNLKHFLLSKYPQERELIETLITQYADSIGYEEDSFTYGGRRRFRKSKKSNKKSKKANKKSKKTRKHK